MRTMAFSLLKMNSLKALASSVLPTPVGPRKMNEPMRAVRVLQPGPGAAQDARDRFHGLILADDPLLQDLLHVQQLLLFPAQQLADRDAGPLGDDFGDVLLGDLLGQDLFFLLQDRKAFPGRASLSFFFSGNLPYWICEASS